MWHTYSEGPEAPPPLMLQEPWIRDFKAAPRSKATSGELHNANEENRTERTQQRWTCGELRNSPVRKTHTHTHLHHPAGGQQGNVFVRMGGTSSALTNTAGTAGGNCP